MLREQPDEAAKYLTMNLYRVEDPIKKLAGMLAAQATRVEHRPADSTLINAIVRGPEEVQNSEAPATS